MKIRFSIFTKLLIFVLPLTCLPIAFIGYLAYHTSVSTVTRLSRQAQLLQAQRAAERLDFIFQFSITDLKTMSHQIELKQEIPTFKSTLNESTKGLNERILILLKDFILRSPYYHAIVLYNKEGDQVISLPRQALKKQPLNLPSPDELSNHFWINRNGIYISRIFHSPSRQAFSILLCNLLYNPLRKYLGQLVLEIDYSKIMEFVTKIRIGKQGYAFVVDNLGRTIAHPNFEPYKYDLTRYPDPNLRELIVDMISGAKGWKTYYLMGEKAAAYAPIQSTGWSVAVTIPIQEFKNEGILIRKRVKQAVLAALVIAIIVISALSYQMLRPVRRLVAATKEMATGHLDQQIPVKSHDELGTLTSSFNKMVMNLRKAQQQLLQSEKLASIGRISAGVAHEIRNPLNAMKGGVTLLKRRRKNDPIVQKYSCLILEEIERLNLFVTEFLYLAKQSPPKLIQSDINEVIRNTLNLFEEEMIEKKIQVEVSEDGGTSSVLIDPHQMEQVFINVIRNSIEAMPEGGNLKIDVRLKREGNLEATPKELIILISDNGAGISKEILGNIFDPFFSTKETGTGLGLPISLSIIENHGGKLEIDSLVGQGTAVRITLPIIDT